MATFDYAKYSKEQETRNQNHGGNSQKVYFMGEFLKNDGDIVIVRFPYKTMSDLLFESVHKVVGVFPGDRFGKMVRCTGEANCPLCNHPDENVKKRLIRFYAKMVVYMSTEQGVKMVPTVWERPAMFADSDLKALITEYGDLTNYLFKISRTGTGTNTRYNIIPVNMQSPVYSGEAFRKDLSCLDGVDPIKILSKSMDQYLEVVNGEAKETNDVKTESAPSDVFNTHATTPTQPVQEAPVTEKVQPTVTEQPTKLRYSF